MSLVLISWQLAEPRAGFCESAGHHTEEASPSVRLRLDSRCLFWGRSGSPSLRIVANDAVQVPLQKHSVLGFLVPLLSLKVLLNSTHVK